MDNFDKKTKAELMTLAKTHKLRGRSTMNKKDLINALTSLMKNTKLSPSPQPKIANKPPQVENSMNLEILSLNPNDIKFITKMMKNLNLSDDIEVNLQLLSKYKKDIDKYTSNTMEITPNLADSVKEWPRLKSEFLLVRGQFKKSSLDHLSKIPFFSTSLNLINAVKFAGEDSDCCLFIIRVQPGTPYLFLNNQAEYEILIGSGGNFSIPEKKPLKYIKKLSDFKDDYYYFEGFGAPQLYEVSYHFAK